MSPNPTNAEPRNLADLIGRAASENPGKIALIDGDRTLTWSELAQAVDRLAAGVAARSLSPGDRLGLLLPNSIEFAVGYFGALRAGLVALPLNTAYRAAGLVPFPPHPAYAGGEPPHQLAAPPARLVVTDAEHIELAGEVDTLVAG